MKMDQVAIQLYTLRDFCKTSADFAQTARKVREIGYRAVQVSGVGPIPEEEIVKILQGEGLVCCATHEPGPLILSDPQKVVDRLGKLSCSYTAYPFPAGIDLRSREAVIELAKGLDRSGEVLRKAGQVLCYHNHAHEFEKLGSKTILEILFDESHPQNLQGEIDTYWVQYGGGDSAAWCRKLKNRLPLLHLKDLAVDPETHQPMIAEIGSGNLDFKGILEEAERSGCLWFIVEQDTCPGDPFVSIRKSFDYIRENLIS
jgi:sugar phosphate isomerase/epimerase